MTTRPAYMDDPSRPDDVQPETVPQATVRKRSWTLPVIWVVPLMAALVTAYLLIGRQLDNGPLLTLRFEDGGGIRAEQTVLEYRGVSIGLVKDVHLSTDLQHVIVKVRLRRAEAAIARQGSQFWIVRLRSGLDSFAHVGEAVGTVFSGPYIEVLPGLGPSQTDFVGRDSPPAVEQRGALHIVLRTTHIGSMRPGVPILYRGVDVGAVQDFQLSRDGSVVNINAMVKPRYARLVRSNSRFRDVTGGHLRFSLFDGLQVDVQSLRSLLSGGIEFSTPSTTTAKPATDGTVFQLGSGAVPKAAHGQQARNAVPIQHF